MTRLSIQTLVFFALGSLLTACQDSSSSAAYDRPVTDAGGLHLEGVSSDLVQVGHPKVQIDDDVMTITGNVRRAAGRSEDVSGRVDIEVLGSKGEQLAWLTAVVSPNPLPTDGSDAGYEIHYGWTPPGGATVRVHFVDTKTAMQEDAGGGGHYTGATGGSHGGGGGHGGGRHMGW
jgi:hypothetical protein